MMVYQVSNLNCFKIKSKLPQIKLWAKKKIFSTHFWIEKKITIYEVENAVFFLIIYFVRTFFFIKKRCWIIEKSPQEKFYYLDS